MSKFRILLGAAALAIAAVAIVACSKEKAAQQETSTAQQSVNEKAYTLAEMAEAMSWEEDKALLENQPIKDYTSVCEKVLNDCGPMEKSEVISYGVSWEYMMAGGVCNPQFPGTCLIIKYNGNTTNQANAIGFFEDGKLVIVPTTNEDGFTVDGYLAVGAPIEIQNDSIVITEGVYSAYFDDGQGKYVAVAVDYDVLD